MEDQVNFKKNLDSKQIAEQQQQKLKQDYEKPINQEKNQDLPLQQNQMEVQVGLGGTGCSPEKIQNMTKAAEDFYSNEKNQHKFTFASPQQFTNNKSSLINNNTNQQTSYTYSTYQKKYQQEINWERQERLRKKQQIQEEINQLRRRMEDLEMSISKKQQQRETIQSPSSQFQANYSANKYQNNYTNIGSSTNELRGYSGEAEKQFKENLYDQKVRQYSDSYQTNMQKYEANINFGDVRKQQIQREQELQESIKKRKQILLSLNQNQQQYNSLQNAKLVSPSQEKFNAKMKQEQASQIGSSETATNLRPNMSTYSKSNQQQNYNNTAPDQQYYSLSTKYANYMDSQNKETSVERLHNAMYQDYASQEKQQSQELKSPKLQSNRPPSNNGQQQKKQKAAKKKKNSQQNIYEKYKQDRDQQRQSMDQRILQQTIENKVFSPEKVKDDFETNKFYFNNKYNSDQVYQNYQKEQELKNLVSKVKTSVKKQILGQKSESSFQKFKVQKIYKHNCVKQNTGKNLPFKIRGPKDQIEIKYFGSPKPCQQCMLLLVQGLPTSLCQSHGNPDEVIMPENQIPNRFEKQIRKKKLKL